MRESKEDLINDIVDRYHISPITATILVNRNITKDEDIVRFMEPNKDKFYDPYLLKDMEKAVDRILRAKENNEKVYIYGDYDVGATRS